MIRIGLTGSIGMGKSTTAKLFADESIPVNDADAVVHDLYRGVAVPAISASFPEAVVDGVVNRGELSRTLAKNPARFAELEGIIHPLVQAEERRFIQQQEESGADIVVLDIPLLFEVGAQDRVDAIVVVSCDAESQRERVLARPGMTEEKFKLILSRQMPDAEKRSRADYIVETDHGIDTARARVRQIIEDLRKGTGHHA